MGTPWAYCADLHAGDITLDASEARHVRGSLRLRAGDALTLFDGRGHLGHGRVAALPAARGGPGRRRMEFRVHVAALQAVPPPAAVLALIVAACKGPRLGWMVEKCTELGVGRIVLAEFERSVVHTTAGHAARLAPTAISACKQAGRAWLPELAAGVPLAEAVAGRGPGALVVAHRSSDALPFVHWLAELFGRASGLRSSGERPDRNGYQAARPGDGLRSGGSVAGSSAREVACPSPPNTLTAVVGPEGGLTDGELAGLRAAGGQLILLGEHTLRVETAAIAIAAGWSAAV